MTITRGKAYLSSKKERSPGRRSSELESLQKRKEVRRLSGTSISRRDQVLRSYTCEMDGKGHHSREEGGNDKTHNREKENQLGMYVIATAKKVRIIG